LFWVIQINALFWVIQINKRVVFGDITHPIVP